MMIGILLNQMHGGHHFATAQCLSFMMLFLNVCITSLYLKVYRACPSKDGRGKVLPRQLRPEGVDQLHSSNRAWPEQGGGGWQLGHEVAVDDRQTQLCA